MNISKENKQSIEKYAKEFGVSSNIHPEDFIFQYVFNHGGFPSVDSAIRYYFSDGQNSAKKLEYIINNICHRKSKTFNILEFASGYGCVTRQYKNILPMANITACDIHEEATSFLSENLKVDTLLSSTIPEQLKVPEQYDFVFALSFFSHMPKATFSRWLSKLLSCVKPNGYLIFTTHGITSHKRHLKLMKFDEEGFSFHSLSEQKDLDKDDYGTTIVSPEYMFEIIEKVCPNKKLKCFIEGYWWEHQDLYVIENN